MIALAKPDNRIDFHEVANIFPMMSDEEYCALVADIQANGLREPVWTHQGKIIDGRNRYRACLEIGLEPRFRTWDGNGSLVAFVVSLNLKRRHLTSSQRAMVAVDVEERLAEEAKEKERQRKMTSEIFQKSPPEPIYAAQQAATITGTNTHYVHDAKRIVAQAPELKEAVLNGSLSIPQAKAIVNRAQIKAKEVELPTGKYSCLVVDPPWTMQKIERDVRPNQVEFDYPTMNEEELKAFPLPDFAADDCHLYLWTTQKHLPLALRLAEHWGFKYQCLLTWRKNVGFTPFSWMYSTEHVLFCTRGSLPLLRLGVRLDFEAKVREHSRKPDEFYDIVREVSPGPRLDVFSREKREGFEQHGNEVEKYV